MRVEVVNRCEDGSPQYRLGDAVLRRDHEYGRRAFEAVADAPQFFEGTILLEYTRRVDKTSPDPHWSVLRELVENRAAEPGIEIPAEDELVAHLRLGHTKGYDRPAAEFVDYICELLEQARELHRVSIVTAVHHGGKFIEQHRERSVELTSTSVDTTIEIVEQLRSRGWEVELRSNPDIDADFCYLARAGSLVLGNGHFSLCAAMIGGADVFVPPWSREGTDLDIDELLASRSLA